MQHLDVGGGAHAGCGAVEARLRRLGKSSIVLAPKPGSARAIVIGTLNKRAIIMLEAWAGMIGPTCFVVTFTLEGWLRPGYDPLGMFVSELSLGPRGWIQIASFVVPGTLFLVFAGDHVNAYEFIEDLSRRIVNRFQLTTDGLEGYIPAVEEHFGANVDFAQLVKQYAHPRTDGPDWFRPSSKVGAAIPTPHHGESEGRAYQHVAH